MILLLGLCIGAMSYFESSCGLWYVYYLDGTSCDWGDGGCYEIDSSGDCVEDTCLYGYYWESTLGYCSGCDDIDAMTCDDEGVPETCWDGYYLDGTTCMDCETEYGDDCSTCDATTCLTTDDANGAICDDGMAIDCNDIDYTGYDDYAYTCTCSGSGASSEITVTSCEAGYGLTESTFVSHDGPWCADCDGGSYTGTDAAASDCTLDNSGAVVVTACFSGYCLYDDSGYQCWDMGGYLGGVDTCTYDATTSIETALTCDAGYGTCMYDADNTDCYLCNSGQSTCTFTDTACDTVATYTCFAGYADDGDGTGDTGVCHSCGAYCATCTWDGSAAACTACTDQLPWVRGYYVDTTDDTCTTCGSYCNTCTDYTTCTTCVTMVDNDYCYDTDTGGDDTDGGDDTGDDAGASLEFNPLFF